MSKRPTVCGVQVHTWGTAYDEGQGIWSHLKTILYGGNVGHASMTLIIPDNEKSEHLIKKYCFKDGKILVPYGKREVRFPDGNSEKVYEIYFSFYDDYMEAKLLQDKLDFLFEFDFKWTQQLGMSNQQQKIVKGWLGHRVISRGPVSVEHYGSRNELNDVEIEVLSKLAENEMLNIDIEYLNTLKDKLSRPNIKKIVMSDSTRLFIVNLFSDDYFNKFADMAASNLNMSVEQLLLDVDRKILKLSMQISMNEKNIEKDFPKYKEVAKNTYIKNYSIDEFKERYLTLGEPPYSIYLPIYNNIAADVGSDNGLNVEAMLSEMSDLADNNDTFELYDKNCSEAVAQILESGIQQPHLKSMIAERTIFGVNNPQMVYNTALKVHQGITNSEKTNVWHRLKVFNPAAPIKKAIKSLISFSYKHRAFIPIGLLVLSILLISVAVVKIITLPFNMLGYFMAKESQVHIVDNKDNNIWIDATELTAQRERKILDQELKDLIQPKIKEVSVMDPIAAILEFAADLEDKDAIPVFSNTSIDKLKKYMNKHSDTPEDLVKKIQKLNLDFPKELNYKDLSDLVDALQLLAAQRVTDSVATLHDTIKNRKTTETTQFTGDAIQTKDSISSEDPDNKTNKKPASQA